MCGRGRRPPGLDEKGDRELEHLVPASYTPPIPVSARLPTAAPDLPPISTLFPTLGTPLPRIPRRYAIRSSRRTPYGGPVALCSPFRIFDALAELSTMHRNSRRPPHSGH